MYDVGEFSRKLEKIHKIVILLIKKSMKNKWQSNKAELNYI
jgi:hypothetical protein